MMKEENKEQKQNSAQYDSDQWKVGPKGFIALIVAILFFSGVLVNFPDMKWLSAFDFSVISLALKAFTAIATAR